MKKSILVLLLATSLTAVAQNSNGESNNLSIITAPGTYIDFGHKNYTNDGFNIGLQYEYQNKTIYVGPEVFLFPDLNGFDYVHVIGRFGFNKEFGRFNKFRIYAGGRGGVISRETVGFQYGILGGEVGAQYTHYDSGIFIKIAGITDSKTDSQLWSAEPNHNVKSIVGGIGIRF